MPCTCEKKSFQDAYSDEMQSTLVSMGLDEPNTEARILVAQTLRPRFASDRQTAIREAENLPEYEVPEAAFTITHDGHVLYTQYDRTLVELHERQLRLQPDQYSKIEHEISRSIEHAFQQGATEVVTSYPREGEDNRDIIVMRWDPTTSKGTTSVINTQADGKNHGYEYVHATAVDRFTNLRERDVTIGRGFVLSNEEPKMNKGSFFEKSFGKSNDLPTPQREIIGNEIQRSTLQVQDAVVNDVADTIHGISQYIQTTKQHKQTEQTPPFFRRLFQLGTSKKDQHTAEMSNSHAGQNRIEIQKPTRRKQELSVVIPRRKDQKKLVRLGKAQNLKLEQQQSKPQTTKENMEQSVLPITPDVSRKKIKTRKVGSEAREEVQERPLLVERKGKDKKRLTHHFIEQSGEEKAYKKRVKRLFIRAIALFTIFEMEKRNRKQNFVYEKQKGVRLKKESPPTQFIRREINKQVTAYIANILFSLALFELLRKSNEQHRYIQTQINNEKNIRTKQGDDIEYKDFSSPWVLLSIIWYLVMLREQGKLTVIGKKKQQKSKKKRSVILFQFQPGKTMQTQAVFMI